MSEPFWKDLDVIVCAGTGGVGKTTVAAALGAWIAMSGKRVLVLTIDPAKRLAQALGLSAKLEHDVVVPDPRLGGRLSATMLDAQSVFDKFVRRAAPDSATAERLLKNRLYQQLATSLSGSQEFTSLERVQSAMESGLYDVLILDTPPTQNTVDFLKAPGRIFSLFQDNVTKWFRKEGGESGFFAAIFSRGTRTVISTLEKVTGSQFISELTDFFTQMAALQGQVRERSLQVEQLLASPRTGFVLVTGFDEAKLREAMEFRESLAEQKYQLSAVILNRAFPDEAMKTSSFGAPNDPKVQALNRFFETMRSQFAHRLELTNALEKQIAGVPFLKLTEMKASPQGIEEILALSENLKQRSKA